MHAPDLMTIDRYRRLFTDASYWAPFVKTVCKKHDLEPVHEVKAGEVPGTYPVFIVDDKWVVKFFGTHFNGQRTFAIELEVNQLLYSKRDVPSPALVAHGYLLEDDESCRWPYLVFEFVDRKSLGEVRGQLSQKDKAEIARTIGVIAHRLHSYDISKMLVLRPMWNFYSDMLQRQYIDCAARHRDWCSLPEYLIDQIDDFILSPEEMVDRCNPPSLLHGDLTADHVLVIHDGDEWKLKAIIDYGDALVGDPMYELIALHLDLFGCDKNLLREYLSAYGHQQRIESETARKLLSLSLLFPFNAFYRLFEHNPSASRASDLNELADWIWNTEL